MEEACKLRLLQYLPGNQGTFVWYTGIGNVRPVQDCTVRSTLPHEQRRRNMVRCPVQTLRGLLSLDWKFQKELIKSSVKYTQMHNVDNKFGPGRSAANWLTTGYYPLVYPQHLVSDHKTVNLSWSVAPFTVSDTAASVLKNVFGQTKKAHTLLQVLPWWTVYLLKIHTCLPHSRGSWFCMSMCKRWRKRIYSEPITNKIRIEAGWSGTQIVLPQDQ